MKSLKEIGEHVSLFKILASLRFSSVGPLRGSMDGLRNLVYGLPGAIGLQDVGLSLGRAISSISSLDLPDRLLEDEPIMLWVTGEPRIIVSE